MCGTDHATAGSIRRAARGFSLVELSIVLVILGLLTGGILAGQSLIRAAELRSVITQAQNFIAATNSFRDKYLSLPGDMPDATKFWGAVGGGTEQCATPQTATDTGQPTCNGNGNGIVDETITSLAEPYRFWEHLAAAGLIEGTYAGISEGGTSLISSPGYNVPTTRIGQGGWESRVRTTAAGDSIFFNYAYGNMLQFGAPQPAGTPYLPLITPEEAWNIDSKMDDGKPAQGKAIAVHILTCTNATLNTDRAVEYRLTSNGIACAMLFRDVF